MADGVQITQGSGTTIATDDVGGVQWQRVKVGIGADGTAGDVSTANPMPVRGAVVRVDAEFTRPANTTAYSTGDVVSNSASATTLVDLSNAVRVNGGDAYIVAVRVTTDKKSITPVLRVHFANASDITVSADNAANRGPLYADTAKYLGYIDLPALATPADTANATASTAANNAVRLPVVAGGSTRSLFAWVETRNNFTPASGQKTTITVFVDNN